MSIKIGAVVGASVGLTLAVFAPQEQSTVATAKAEIVVVAIVLSFIRLFSFISFFIIAYSLSIKQDLKHISHQTLDFCI